MNRTSSSLAVLGMLIWAGVACKNSAPTANKAEAEAKPEQAPPEMAKVVEKVAPEPAAGLKMTIREAGPHPYIDMLGPFSSVDEYCKANSCRNLAPPSLQTMPGDDETSASQTFFVKADMNRGWHCAIALKIGTAWWVGIGVRECRDTQTLAKDLMAGVVNVSNRTLGDRSSLQVVSFDSRRIETLEAERSIVVGDTATRNICKVVKNKKPVCSSAIEGESRDENGFTLASGLVHTTFEGRILVIRSGAAVSSEFSAQVYDLVGPPS